MSTQFSIPSRRILLIVVVGENLVKWNTTTIIEFHRSIYFRQLTISYCGSWKKPRKAEWKEKSLFCKQDFFFIKNTLLCRTNIWYSCHALATFKKRCQLQLRGICWWSCWNSQRDESEQTWNYGEHHCIKTEIFLSARVKTVLPAKVLLL